MQSEKENKAVLFVGPHVVPLITLNHFTDFYEILWERNATTGNLDVVFCTSFS
jgi:hypothetical protein